MKRKTSVLVPVPGTSTSKSPQTILEGWNYDFLTKFNKKIEWTKNNYRYAT